MDEYAWLAGLLEGEGTFLKGSPSLPWRPRVRLSMTDEDVVRRAADIVGIKSIQRYDQKNPNWKPCYIMQVSGQRAVDLMRLIRPTMGLRRQGQIDVALACWNPLRERNRERNEAILGLYQQGLGYAEIGRKLELPRQAVRGVIRRYLDKQDESL
jgi:hypothetical protein